MLPGAQFLLEPETTVKLLSLLWALVGDCKAAQPKQAWGYVFLLYYLKQDIYI